MLHIYRVVVRGRFDALDAETRGRLVAELADHDALDAAFRPEGTLTYRTDIDFFSFRYEVRTRGDDPVECEAEAAVRAEAMAHSYMSDHALPYRDLKIATIDMADVWA